MDREERLGEEHRHIQALTDLLVAEALLLEQRHGLGAITVVNDNRRHQRLALVFELLVQLNHLLIHHVERDGDNTCLEVGVAFVEGHQLLIGLGTLQVKRQHQLLFTRNRQRHTIGIGDDKHRHHLELLDRIGFRDRLSGKRQQRECAHRHASAQHYRADLAAHGVAHGDEA